MDQSEEGQLLPPPEDKAAEKRDITPKKKLKIEEEEVESDEDFEKSSEESKVTIRKEPSRRESNDTPSFFQKLKTFKEVLSQNSVKRASESIVFSGQKIVEEDSEMTPKSQKSKQRTLSQNSSNSNMSPTALKNLSQEQLQEVIKRKVAKKFYQKQAKSLKTRSASGIGIDRFQKLSRQIIGANLSNVFRKLSNENVDMIMNNLNYTQYVERFELENERMMEKEFQNFLSAPKQKVYGVVEKWKNKAITTLNNNEVMKDLSSLGLVKQTSKDNEFEVEKAETPVEPPSVQFDLSDLESLQDAQIDNGLLETHFLHQRKQKSRALSLQLEKHCKIFGVVMIPREKLFEAKKSYIQAQQKAFLTRLYEHDKQIETLRRQIENKERLKTEMQVMRKMRRKGNILIEYSQDKRNQLNQHLATVKGSLALAQIRRDETIQQEKAFLQMDDVLAMDHRYADIMYSELVYRQEFDIFEQIKNEFQEKKNQLRTQVQSVFVKKQGDDVLKIEEEGPDDENKEIIKKMEEAAQEYDAAAFISHIDQIGPENINQTNNRDFVTTVEQVKAKWTFSPVSGWYRAWTITVTISCLVSTIMYPMASVNQFPALLSIEFNIIMLCELIFFIDIVLNFFKQKLDEAGLPMSEPLEVVASNYLTSDFKMDFFAFLPWGYVASVVDHRLVFFWVLKAVRIKMLDDLVSDRKILPIVENYIEWKQAVPLADPELRDDINDDHVFINRKIFLKNMVTLLRLTAKLLFVAFFIGQYWYVYSKIIFEFRFTQLFEQEGLPWTASQIDWKDDEQIPPYALTFVVHFDSWSFQQMTPGQRIITNTYYALTTLSTVGFGDFYPVSDYERLGCAFMLIFGVAIFSLFLTELRDQFLKLIAQIDIEVNREEDLERFFVLISKFNHGQPLDNQLVSDIYKYFSIRWLNNRNNFLLDAKDHDMFKQLPIECQTKIYTDFIFREFLNKFRRFFTFPVTLFENMDIDVETNAKKNAEKKTRNISIMKEGQIIHNKNILKMRRLVRQIITLSRCLRNKTQYELSKEESLILTNYYRRRVTEIEQKQQLEKQKRLEQIKANRELKYGQRHGQRIVYPFLTFQNDVYANFMTLIMEALEIRIYEPGQLIIKELDEASEILFVVQGRYEVGYEINKKNMNRAQFGHSTVIGLFEMCFHKRHLFNMHAHCSMVAYSLRKHKFFKIMKENPDFYRIIKFKGFQNYYNKIYKPLMKQKTVVIKRLSQRSDFFQVMAIADQTFEGMKICMKQIYEEAELFVWERRTRQIENYKISWLIRRAEEKIQTYANYAHEMTHRSEWLQKSLWIRIKKAISKDRIENPQAFIKEFYDMIVPTKRQAKLKLLAQMPIDKRRYTKASRKLLESNNMKNVSQMIRREQAHGLVISYFQKELATRDSTKAKLIDAQRHLGFQKLKSKRGRTQVISDGMGVINEDEEDDFHIEEDDDEHNNDDDDYSYQDNRCFSADSSGSQYSNSPPEPRLRKTFTNVVSAAGFIDDIEQLRMKRSSDNLRHVGQSFIHKQNPDCQVLGPPIVMNQLPAADLALSGKKGWNSAQNDKQSGLNMTRILQKRVQLFEPQQKAQEDDTQGDIEDGATQMQEQDLTNLVDKMNQDVIVVDSNSVFGSINQAPQSYRFMDNLMTNRSAVAPMLPQQIAQEQCKQQPIAINSEMFMNMVKAAAVKQSQAMVAQARTQRDKILDMQAVDDVQKAINMSLTRRVQPRDNFPSFECNKNSVGGSLVASSLEPASNPGRRDRLKETIQQDMPLNYQLSADSDRLLRSSSCCSRKQDKGDKKDVKEKQIDNQNQDQQPQLMFNSPKQMSERIEAELNSFKDSSLFSTKQQKEKGQSD